MAALSPRLWWFAVALLLWTPQTQCREFTHEDIRDAMVSIVHTMRLSEDKLERHEYREKTLGDQLKRMVTSLIGKHRELEPLKGMVSRLDERLSNVETILLHKEEREKSTQKKTNDALEGIKKSIQTLTAAVENLKPSKAPAEIENNLTTNDESMEKRFDMTDTKIDNVKNQIENLKKTFNKDAIRSMCLEVAPDMNRFEKHISDAEKLLSRFDLKLNEYNETKASTDFPQLNEVALADEAWHSKMNEEMEHQGKEITKIQRLLSDAEGVWKQLPKLSDLQTTTNQTLDAVVKGTAAISENTEATVNKIATKLRQLGDRLATTNEDIQQSLTQSNTLSERAFSDMSRGYDTLHTEVQSLMKSEKVMLQTADNVIANKKRIEYGVHQILMQVTELILKQGKGMNETLNERLEHIEASLMGNQALSQVNLSSKIETEISQVWRQIGIMHEQLKASKSALDKLTEETEHYVNSSTTTMGKVKDDVSIISSRMGTLSEDFNYALGRLGLVTQEFSQISTGLADAISSLKKDVQAVQAKTEMEHQGKEITKIQRLLSDAEGVWKQLPKLSDLQTTTNQTLDAVVKGTAAISENTEATVNKIATKLRQLGDRLATTNEDIQQSLTQSNTLSERAFSDMSRGYDTLHTEVQSLMKSEKVMLQTADNVIANKKRIEYGVHQILMQVTELILKQGKGMNETLNERLEHIEASLMGNQALSQVNLSSKIETEISQVWRQIGIMHEQLKASKSALDKLTEETEHYVNSSTTTMGKVKDDVSIISSRMGTLSEDFNYALGRLGLVTQEFSQISTGLADAISSLKKDVQAVQAKTDAGPGPHKISNGEKTP